jgi:hypothetical protein
VAVILEREEALRLEALVSLCSRRGWPVGVPAVRDDDDEAAEEARADPTAHIASPPDASSTPAEAGVGEGGAGLVAVEESAAPLASSDSGPGSPGRTDASETPAALGDVGADLVSQPVAAAVDSESEADRAARAESVRARWLALGAQAQELEAAVQVAGEREDFDEADRLETERTSVLAARARARAEAEALGVALEE